MIELTDTLFVSISRSVLKRAAAKSLVEIISCCRDGGRNGYLDIRVQNRDGIVWRGYVHQDAYQAATQPDVRNR